jgi:hypothetical protein
VVHTVAANLSDSSSEDLNPLRNIIHRNVHVKGGYRNPLLFFTIN